MRRFFSIVTICFMITAIFSGCGILQKLGLEKSQNDELQPVSSIAMNEADALSLNAKTQIHLYFAEADGGKLKSEVRYIPMKDVKKSPNSLATTIVNELIKGPAKGTSLKATIPKNTKQMSLVDIDVTSGIATVNLSPQFVKDHPGGMEAERLTIYSIVNTLTEMKEIDKVAFLIDGEKRKEYKGSFQFDVPFPRTVALIDTEATSKGAASSSPTPVGAYSKIGSTNTPDASGTFNNVGPEEMSSDGLE